MSCLPFYVEKPSIPSRYVNILCLFFQNKEGAHSVGPSVSRLLGLFLVGLGSPEVWKPMV